MVVAVTPEGGEQEQQGRPSKPEACGAGIIRWAQGAIGVALSMLLKTRAGSGVERVRKPPQSRAVVFLMIDPPVPDEGAQAVGCPAVFVLWHQTSPVEARDSAGA